MPQVKISTQAAVFRPTPGSESRNSQRLLARRRPVQSRSGSSPSCSRIAWIRGAFCLRQAARPDRLLDLGDRRVADLLPGGEALAQRREGAVAVAVVGVLGEDRLAPARRSARRCGSLTGTPYISRSRSRIARTRRRSGSLPAHLATSDPRAAAPEHRAVNEIQSRRVSRLCRASPPGCPRVGAMPGARSAILVGVDMIYELGRGIADSEPRRRDRPRRPGDRLRALDPHLLRARPAGVLPARPLD